MSTRNLELNLRARANTADLERVEKKTNQLAESLRKSSRAFDEARQEAAQLAAQFGKLSDEEAKSIQNAAKTAAAVEQAAAARERAAAAASNAAAAENRALATTQQAEQAILRKAAAEEKLVQAQAGTATSVARAASAEEKLAQERQKTLTATARTEKEEIAVLKAREQLRAATARAEKAEQSLAGARKSTGLATSIVAKQLQALVAGGLLLTAGKQMLEFGKSSIQAASDAEEAAAKFQQVFRDAAVGVREDLEVMADANRRSVYDLISYASTLQDTFVPLGFTREAAADLSTTITQLGIDIAAFSNRSDSETIDNLTSAIVGNHEAVRSYGIVLTETVLKQELARMGALELTGAQLEVAKAQARVNLIMRASADAQGAAVREAGSYANTLKAWDAAILELKVSLGEGLLPMMTQLVEIAIRAAEVIGQQQANALREANANALEMVDTHDKVLQLARDTKLQLDEELKTSYRHGSSANPTVEALDDIIVKLAQSSSSSEQFKAEIDELGLSWSELARIARELDVQGLEPTVERLVPQIRAAALELDKYNQIKEEAAAADRVLRLYALEYAYAIEEEAVALDKSALIVETFADKAVASLERYATALSQTKAATQAAREEQEAWNAAFGNLILNAPVDDLFNAQKKLQENLGEWNQISIDKSGEIAEIQAALAGDLTDAQEKELKKQLAGLDQFSDAYLDIVRQLEGDLSDTQRLELTGDLRALEAQQGMMAAVYSGDLNAVKEAREEIIAANRAIQDSYMERAFGAISARLIEEGAWEQLGQIGVALGIWTQAEADARMTYALTAAEIDKLTAATTFYGLTAAQQAGAVQSLAAGIYATADAAIQAQQNLQQVSNFYNTAPDSSQIGDFYRNLGTQAASDEGITTTVGVTIRPDDQQEFNTWRDGLQEYDDTTYETDIAAAYGTTLDDFESMRSVLGELTEETWVIKVKYETDGAAPSGDVDADGIPGNGRGGGVKYNRYGRSGPFIDRIQINNYGGGGTEQQVRRGIQAAFRSMG